MKSQIIKEYVPFFIDFLTQNAKTESNYVLFNEELFRKCQYVGSHTEFLEQLRPYYHKSKQFYLDRDNMSYSQFITILRQISNATDVKYVSKVKYNQSKYSIEYYFYISED